MTRIHRLISMTVLVVSFGAAAHADERKDVFAEVSLFAGGLGGTGGGGSTGLMGVGGELFFGPLGFGAEASLLGPGPAFSLGSSFRFRDRANWTPYLRGGWTLISSDSPNLLHFGAGIRYRAHEKWIMTFELRDHVFLEDGTGHLVSLRFGVTIPFD